MSDYSQQQHSLDEIASLKAQLASKDEQISELKARLNSQSPSSNSNYTKAKATIKSVIKSVQESLPPSDVVSLNELQTVSEEFDLSSQIQKFTHFLVQRAKAVPRLCAQLRGHVDFLTRLASSPHLQSLFLISDHSGSIFLPETARQLLLEQAARTSQLIIDQAQTNQSSSSSYGNIDTNLNLNSNLSKEIDLDQRLPAIKKLLSDEINDPNELSSLLLQEVLISSALQRTASSADNYLRQIYGILSGSSSEETEKCNKDNEYVNNNDFEGGNFSYDKVLHLARSISPKGTNIPAEKSHHSVRSIDLTSNNANEWNRWAKRLYYGLTQLPADSQDDACLRIAIEEAALTSIGTQVLQNRLKSLRIQKSVMKQPKIQVNDQIKFSTSLICVISCIRMISRVNSSNMYSTKHKVSKWA